MLKNFFEKKYDIFYAICRVLVGFLFMAHGAQKLFGVFGGTKQTLMSLMGAAGIIEFIGGIAIMIGLYTSYVAIIAAIVMLVAYFKAHAANGLMPIVNKGELALLYFAVFLVIMAQGSRKFAVDNLFKKK